MKKKLLLVAIVIGAIVVKPCFGQEGELVVEDQKRAAVSFGVFHGGGGIVGADLEFLIGGRFGLQIGAGFPTIGAGINYHFKPQINSSFVSLQYFHVGVGESKVASLVGPMYVFRARRLLQLGVGWGAVTSKGPLWEKAMEKNPEASMLLQFTIGLYFPF